MKRYFLLLVTSLMILYEVNCFHRPHHRKRSRNLMKRVPTSKPPLSDLADRETLKEALQLLNVGKKTLGLNTEDPDLLLQLVDNPNEKNKSENIEKLLEDPKQIPHAPIGKQFLALSGENGKVRVDNFTNLTPSPSEKALLPSNDSDIRDIFKMIMEKKSPDSQSKVFHKITIIETNQLKPYSNKELSQSAKSFKRRRRHKGWHLARKFHIRPHTRQKRSKFVPMLNFYHRKHPTNFDETPFFRKQIPKKRNITNWRDNVESRIEISLSKFPNPEHVNKRTYGDKTFIKSEDNYIDKEFFPSGNGRFERKENIKEGSEKQNIADNNFRFSDENLEKLIDSIGFESSLKTVFVKTTSKAITAEGNIISTISSNKPSIATSTKTANVIEGTRIQKHDFFPPLDVDRYALAERVLTLERGRESMLSVTLEVAAIMSSILLFFFALLMMHSKLYRVTPTPSEKATKTKKEQVASNILNKNYPCSMYCYKTVAVEEDDQGLRSLEWQSEFGDWLSDNGEKEKL